MSTKFYDETTHQWIEEPSANPMADEGAPESDSPPLEETKES